ncbi:DUF302 domain-containing protein [Sulfurimonas marina]|uniref:DUF302 domain-containing protein n=1 Tax=Sulfurimonas marina TaxID=2590551 RepID=A0A7M1AVY2_9BACT|nr:DUF302 domain-containing protein [Sulfurimonas marina]QOP40522.1 DUF302 domain-containing protein [Sulfurimonas marina]
MKSLLFLITFSLSLFSSEMIIKESSCSVDQTVLNIQNIVKNKGLALFATIDHGANAKDVGMELSDSKVVIFGNPKLGTTLMQQDIKAGLDLPLRILVYKDQNGNVKMAYRDGSWLAEHHLLNAPKKIAKVNNAMDKITTRAGQCKKD